MEEAAVEFLLNNLKDLLLYHSHLITDSKNQIENLEKDLHLFKRFLKDSLRKRRKDERTKVLVRNIRDVVYEVEDVIDAFITQAMEKKATSSFFKLRKPSLNLFKLRKPSLNLHKIGVKVAEVRTEVEKAAARIDFIHFSTHDEDNYEKSETRPPRKKGVVGFVEEAKYLINRVMQDTEYLDVISVIGMFGLGKTTLAWRVFNDPDIGFKFPTRIWLTDPQKFTHKEMFQKILNNLNVTLDESTRAKEGRELGDIVAEYLQNGRYLIVIDDVWEAEDWEKVSVALPSHNPKGKVLITSRNEDVGMAASRPRPRYNLRMLTEEESWELLQLEALGKLDCPPELEQVGRKIVENCGGLPLAIVVIGGILADYLGTNLYTTKREWEKVSKHVNAYLIEGDQSKRIWKFSCLSYDNLPYHLRPCFLYLGLFPEDYEIPVSRLIRMWIAEGFIPQKDNYTFEETGEKYLEDLISRNLVKSAKFKLDGKVKTCRIHGILREFCRTEAETENFFQEIKSNRYGEYVPSISKIDTCRRLSIHPNCLDFIESKVFGSRVRSFVCFSEDKYEVSAERTNIVGASKFLRVLDVLPFKFATIDSELYNLVHMRYIAFALSFKLSNLPSKFQQLANIQTLIIDTEFDTLEVEADILKMKHLRHFKSKACATLKPNENVKGNADQLQTLSLISVESCTEELKLAPNLKKLGICGRLSLLLETFFVNLRRMEHLEKLKLINDTYPNPGREGALGGLLEPYEFPYGLTSLTLCATFLHWEHISTLGLLKKLKVLKLKSRAFMGDTWEVEDGGFLTLQFLHIEETDLAFWKASSHHYPKLRGLVLKNCDKLREIPIELAGIPSLRMLDLSNCILANESARKISDAKMTESPAGGSEFVLHL